MEARIQALEAQVARIPALETQVGSVMRGFQVPMQLVVLAKLKRIAWSPPVVQIKPQGLKDNAHKYKNLGLDSPDAVNWLASHVCISGTMSQVGELITLHNGKILSQSDIMLYTLHRCIDRTDRFGFSSPSAFCLPNVTCRVQSQRTPETLRGQSQALPP